MKDPKQVKKTQSESDSIKTKIAEKYAKNLNTINGVLQKTELSVKSKKKIYKDFESVYLYRQKVFNTITNMQEYSAECKSKFKKFIKKQNIEMLKLRNNK